ncbi:MAG: hypothetical protein Q8P88_00880 [Candidatus Jorgensenbacteria bacterium]|nr:hypothetical protein [Candidatus Jorgensenbacteria bacterium]
MARQEIRFTIVNGPSKFDLMVALFKKDEEVRFTLDSLSGSEEVAQSEVSIMLNGVSVEDGSREHWLISGFYTEPERPAHREVNWTRFEGYYDSRTRTGWLKNVPLQKAG